MLEWYTKSGHKKANDLSHEIKGPKDATKQNGVYKFNCSECKSCYFGETGQRMEKRTYQHKNDVKNSKEINAILKHLQEHNDHSIQWKEVFCLEHKEDWKKRKNKEARYFKAMDSKEIMNREKGFEINYRWNEFDPHIRSIAQNKFVNPRFPVRAFF